MKRSQHQLMMLLTKDYLENKKYYVECSSCLTVYTHKLEIKYVGMPDVHGVS